jgi:hypothetical protein
MSREQFHMQAFVDFLRWASANEGMCNQFRTETGETYSPPKSGLDMMIDTATGRTKKVYERFVEWSAQQYGKEFLPDDVLKAISQGPQ